MALKTVSQNNRIQWETFQPINEWKLLYPFNSTAMSCSVELIPLVLSHSRFRMSRYLDNTTYKIGYGYSDPTVNYGITEPEAYTDWIAAFKKKERDLKNQLSFVSAVTQSQFDALLSLYFLTGSWKTVVSSEGTYDIVDAIKKDEWYLVADMIANGKQDHDQRLREARILALADYNIDKDRTWLRIEGIQYARTIYSRGMNDLIAKKQLENAYYRETQAFLPTMSELKKREIANRYQ